MKLQELFDIFKVRCMDCKEITITSSCLGGISVYGSPLNEILRLDIVNGDLVMADNKQKISKWEMENILNGAKLVKVDDLRGEK